MKSYNGIVVLIPSYNRPEILEITLPNWLRADGVSKIFIVVQASSKDILEKYRNIIERYRKDCEIVCKFTPERLGSVKARNVLLEMARKNRCKYFVMIEDDMLLLNKESLTMMVKELESDGKIGLVGGKVIVDKRRTDPDFFLNLPFNLADLMSRLTGYVFLDVKHGPRFAEYLPQFLMIKKEVLDKVQYDRVFDTPTGFREESDLQLQIKHLGYKLLYDPKVYVVHLAAQEGGNRPKISMGERVYWKARNHTIFILKWNKSFAMRIWYMFFSALILLLYRPWYGFLLLKGLRDGMRYDIR
jgi:GT2 family glycosyltransferase